MSFDIIFNGEFMKRNFIASHVANLPKSGIRAFFDIVAQRHDIISLGVGEPDFDTPWHISRAAEVAIEEGQTHYTSNLGTPQLRKAISDYMLRRYGANYDFANQILVTVGVSEALDLVVRAICEPGDEVLYHEPCFVSYNPTIRMAHAVPVAVETFVEDDFRLTVEELEKKVTPKTKALLLNFPCNPTGAALTEKDMDEITSFVLKHDLLLIADEVYSELAYDGDVKSFASRPELANNLVVLNGFSKAWAMTGYRLGFACGPVDIIDTMMKIHQYGIMSAPTLSQFAGVEAINHGDDDIAFMREEYRRRRNFVVASFNEIGLHTFMPEGAFYVFPDIRSTGLDSHTFALRMLEEHAVACVPGSAFGSCGEGFIRCSYATSMEKLKLAMEQFAKFVKKIS
jgi:aminotransferase